MDSHLAWKKWAVWVVHFAEKIGGKLEDFARALTFAMLKFPVKRQTFHPVLCHHGAEKRGTEL